MVVIPSFFTDDSAATVEVKKQIENYENHQTKSEVLDVDKINKVVKDVVDDFFIQS